MLVKDIVYGEMEILEPILLELLQSKSVQRLKYISQYGVPDKYYFKKNYSRYEHSVGVLILLKKLGASLEEQIAGLLHDVSQFSFSHISDWVFAEGNKGNESYHDSQHENFINKTEVPEILKKCGLNVDKILDETNFTLLENELPDVCADRMDYSLREMVYDGQIDIAEKTLSSIINRQGEIVFVNQESAAIFAQKFLDLQVKHWASKEAVLRYALFSKAFRIAVEKGIVKHDDFWNCSEDYLIKKLEESSEEEIREILNQLRKGDFKKKFGERVYKKFRYVDPLILEDGRLSKLSKLNSEFVKQVSKEKELNARGFSV